MSATTAKMMTMNDDFLEVLTYMDMAINDMGDRIVSTECLVVNMMTKKTRRRRRCSGCKSQYHNIRECKWYFVFGWGSSFITDWEKKLNSERHEELVGLCEYARTKRHLPGFHGGYYSLTLKNCNSFIDRLNFTIEKSKKCEKDIIHNVNIVSKKHHLPLEIYNYIAEYIYKCPYKDGDEKLCYEI